MTLFKRLTKKIVRDSVYYGLRLIIPAALALPLRFALRLGACGGWVAWYAMPFERGVARENLAVAFPELSPRQRDKIGRAAMMNLGKNLAEGIQLDKIRDRVEELVECEGWENFDLARSEGKGAIFFTGHIGSWEMLAAYYSLRDLPGTAIAKEIYDPRIDALLVGLRKRNRLATIHRDDPAINLKIAQVLQQNRMLGILMDQDTRVRGVFAPFFGKPAHTPSGPAYLALKFGIPVVGGFIYRKPDGGHKMQVSEVYHCRETGDLKADIARETGKMNDMLCGWIREHPTHWVWFHRRFKTRPPEETGAARGAPSEPPADEP